MLFYICHHSQLLQHFIILHTLLFCLLFVFFFCKRSPIKIRHLHSAHEMLPAEELLCICRKREIDPLSDMIIKRSSRSALEFHMACVRRQISSSLKDEYLYILYWKQSSLCVRSKRGAKSVFAHLWCCFAFRQNLLEKTSYKSYMFSILFGLHAPTLCKERVTSKNLYTVLLPSF